MKYTVSLVLIFSCIFTVFGAAERVKGLSFTFYYLPKELMPLYARGNANNIRNLLKNKKEKWEHKIEYEIFFENGQSKKSTIEGTKKEIIEKEEDIVEILKNALDLFDKESEDSLDKNVESFKKKFEEVYINENRERIKENYIKENKKNWEKEYIEINQESLTQEHRENLNKNEEVKISDEKKPESTLKKKTWKERLKDPGLFFLGAGLGFAVDRYLLKK